MGSRLGAEVDGVFTVQTQIMDHPARGWPLVISQRLPQFGKHCATIHFYQRHSRSKVG